MTLAALAGTGEELGKVFYNKCTLGRMNPFAVKRISLHEYVSEITTPLVSCLVSDGQDDSCNSPRVFQSLLPGMSASSEPRPIETSARLSAPTSSLGASEGWVRVVLNGF